MIFQVKRDSRGTWLRSFLMFLLGSSVYTILVCTSRAEKVKKLLKCETKKVEVTQWLLKLPTELS